MSYVVVDEADKVEDSSPAPPETEVAGEIVESADVVVGIDVVDMLVAEAVVEVGSVVKEVIDGLEYSVTVAVETKTVWFEDSLLVGIGDAISMME